MEVRLLFLFHAYNAASTKIPTSKAAMACAGVEGARVGEGVATKLFKGTLELIEGSNPGVI